MLLFKLGDVLGLSAGLITIAMCSYQGFYAHLGQGTGARAVSAATTRAVVLSCVLVLALDDVITSFLLHR